LPSPALCHQVDGFGGAAHKDDFLGRRSIEEAANFVARRLVCVRCAGREFVRRAVDVGVLVLIEILEPVDDHLRFLRRSGVVQPD
jgi:hypothetical protein